MQSSLSSAAQPEAILEWLHKEMGYRPLGPYSASSGKSQLPSIESLRKISRGNMIPVWNFLITRVKSDKTVENIRRNITVHGGGNSSASDSGSGGVKEEGRSRGRRKEKVAVEEGLGVAETREAALQERESSAKEVERLRNILRRQRRDLRAKMLEVSREEAERKRMLDERANYRFGHSENRRQCSVLYLLFTFCDLQYVLVYENFVERNGNMIAGCGVLMWISAKEIVTFDVYLSLCRGVIRIAELTLILRFLIF